MTIHQIQEMNKAMATAMSYNITTLNQLRVFVALSASDHPLTAKKIEELAGVPASNVGTIFRSMEDWNMVQIQKERCPETSRIGLVAVMTGKGRAIAAKMGLN